MASKERSLSRKLCNFRQVMVILAVVRLDEESINTMTLGESMRIFPGKINLTVRKFQWAAPSSACPDVKRFERTCFLPAHLSSTMWWWVFSLPLPLTATAILRQHWNSTSSAFLHGIKNQHLSKNSQRQHQQVKTANRLSSFWIVSLYIIQTAIVRPFSLNWIRH